MLDVNCEHNRLCYLRHVFIHALVTILFRSGLLRCRQIEACSKVHSVIATLSSDVFVTDAQAIVISDSQPSTMHWRSGLGEYNLIGTS